MISNTCLNEAVVKEGYEILDLKPEQIFTFSEGIPGFENIKQYCLLSKEEEQPFLHLSALGGYNLEFIVVSPWVVLPAYKPEIGTDDLTFIDSPHENDLIVICMVVLNEPFSESTVNLGAPMIINAKNGKAKQILIRNFKDYSDKQRILQQL